MSCGNGNPVEELSYRANIQGEWESSNKAEENPPRNIIRLKLLQDESGNVSGSASIKVRAFEVKGYCKQSSNAFFLMMKDSKNDLSDIIVSGEKKGNQLFGIYKEGGAVIEVVFIKSGDYGGD